MPNLAPRIAATVRIRFAALPQRRPRPPFRRTNDRPSPCGLSPMLDNPNLA
jgi:hypothetical protein